MTKPWLLFEPIYELTKWYKLEMDARENCGLQYTNQIYENAIKQRDQKKYENENIVRTLVNPKNQLSEEAIKDELAGIILAVSGQKDQGKI